MKKQLFLGAAMISLAAANSFANDGLAELKQELSTYNDGFYAGVEVVDNTLKFPATTVESFYIDETGKLQPQPTEIPSYTAIVGNDGEFAGRGVYKITTDSLDALRSDLYKIFGVDGISAESYKRELYFVPQMQFMKSLKIAAQGVVFQSVDSQTGLKEEIAGVQKINFDSDWENLGDEANYKALWSAANIGIKTPFVSVKIPEIQSQLFSTYNIAANPDYATLINNIGAIVKSNSQIAIKNLAAEIMGIKLSLDIEATGRIQQNESDKTLRLSGKSAVTEIKAESVSDFLPLDVRLKYLLTGISAANIADLQRLQEQSLQLEEKRASGEETASDEEKFMQDMAVAVENTLRTAELKLQADVHFAKADIVSMGAFKKSGNYIIGNSEITIYNLDSLPAEMFNEYIDKSKRMVDAQGRTVDKIHIIMNESGVYVNDRKVSEAIEFDLNSAVQKKLVAKKH